MKKEAYDFGFVCLFGVFPPYSRIFHSYGDVTIAGEGLPICDLCSALMPITCFHALGLSGLGIEPRSFECEGNNLPLCQRGGHIECV